MPETCHQTPAPYSAPHPQEMESRLNIALVGNPNCGKTALFNRLTGSRQKVANYAGATVERKSGLLTTDDGQHFQIIDLPGTYTLSTPTPDESITRNALLTGKSEGDHIDMLILIVDATNLKRSLRMVLDIIRLGYPTVLALNMMDKARKQGQILDVSQLSQSLGIPVAETIAIETGGIKALLDCVAQMSEQLCHAHTDFPVSHYAHAPQPINQAAIQEIATTVIKSPPRISPMHERLDALTLHPFWGYIILAAVLLFMFQAVFSWAKIPMTLLQTGVDATAGYLQNTLPPGVLSSLLVDGVIAGIGSILVFLPQILILFAFILVLEESGYLPRAAFLLDRIMGCVGLSGRAFIPLLSSFACAVPGIMAARTIQDPGSRLLTIMISPLMVCSAKLPVYSLLIAAFIPDRSIGFFNLQGLVLFSLYLAGILAAMCIAWIGRLFTGRNAYQQLMMELPAWHWPKLHGLLLGLWERLRIFISRAGSLILVLMILLWFLSSYPLPPPDASDPPILYSFAGQLGIWLEPLFAPLGFNWQLVIALILGIAAREIVVSALGTVYALSTIEDGLPVVLTSTIAASWSLATALSLLAWYVFAPQCLATLAVVKRETNSWKWPLIMLIYLFTLAWLAAFATYQLTHWITGAS